MKHSIHLLILSVFAAILSSCTDTYTEAYTINTPLYLAYDSLRSSVKAGPPQPLRHPGKIYIKDNRMLIVEKLQGFHLIDITTPSAPKNTAFVAVPGCVDIAVKGQTLYTDSYVDLVAIDLTDLGNIREIHRLRDVYPYTLPPTDNQFPIDETDKRKGVVVGWRQQRSERRLEPHTPNYPINPYYDLYGNGTLDKRFNGFTPESNGGQTIGVGGSMARFGIYDNWLYTADRSTLYVFDISDPVRPTKTVTQHLFWNVETMFLYDRHMFLGTTDGMIVLTLTNPSAPAWISSLQHVTSCDPVVVHNGYAYITLRNGTTCRTSAADINVLDVVKLSADYKNNHLIATYNMTAPYGLGIDGNTLFVCDDGLKVYDITDKYKIDRHLLAHFKTIKAYDVIPLDNFLFTVGDDGFHLYDYTDLRAIRQVATIPVTK